MYDDALSHLYSVDVFSWRWVPDDFIKRLKKQTKINISSDDWVNILSSWLRFGLNNKNIDAGLLAKQLLPFFVLRAIDFWFMSENMTAEEVESVIEEQAVKLRRFFNNKRNENI